MSRSLYARSRVVCALTLCGAAAARQSVPPPPQGAGQGAAGASITSPYDVPQAQASEGHQAHQRGLEFPIEVLQSMHPPAGVAPPPAVDDLNAYAEPEAPQLANNFAGIGYTGWIPPDSQFAMGPQYGIQVVNESFRITDRAGTNLYQTTFANWWSSVIGGVNPYDAQIVYDHFSGRYVLLALVENCGGGTAYYLVSTSWTSNPFQGWCMWALRADVDGSNDTNNWADYPRLGVDSTSLFITSNQFACGGGFQYAKCRVMAKSQFYSNTCGGISWWDFWNWGGDQFTTNPCVTFGFPGAEYLVACASGAGSTVTVRQITGTWPSGSPPSFTTLGTVGIGAFSAPGSWAAQPGGVQGVDSFYAGLMNAVYRGGNIYTCHTIDWAGGTETRCQYVVLSPTALTASVTGAFGAAGLYYFFPAVTSDATGRLYTVFARSGTGEFVGARYTRATAGVFEGSASLKDGEATYLNLDNGLNRWGDFTGIAVDPVNNNFIWIFNEYAKASPQNTWGTWVGQIGDPPANDFCPNAIQISNGVYNGTLVGASNDGTASCGSSATNEDVWYRYTATCDGTLTATMCGTHDTGGIDLGMDSVLSIFSGCGGTELACNDDGFGFCGGLDQGAIRDSGINLAVTAGQSVLLRVSHFSGGAVGPFTLRTSLTMDNDACANATAIGDGVYSGTLACATNDGTATCGASATNPDLWYRYTASCTGNLRVTTCGTHDTGGVDAGMDTVLAIFNGCGGAQLACNDDGPGFCGGLDQGAIRDSGIDLPVSTGQVVVIRVSHFGGSTPGPFTLRVSLTPETCLPSVAPGVVALNCSGGPNSIGVTLTNNSDCTSMSWNSTSNCPSISTSPPSGSIPPNSSQNITVLANCSIVPCGNNGCTVTFNTAGCSPASVPLTVNAFGHPVTVYCTAKTNSLGCVPSIGTNGLQPSISAGNFVVTCTSVLNQKNGLMFWGNGVLSNPFQGGILCVAAPTVRGLNISSGGSAPPANNCTGNYSFTWTTAYFNSFLIGPGTQIYCQWWMRDPVSPSTTGLSNAVHFMTCL